MKKILLVSMLFSMTACVQQPVLSDRLLSRSIDDGAMLWHYKKRLLSECQPNIVYDFEFQLSPEGYWSVRFKLANRETHKRRPQWSNTVAFKVYDAYKQPILFDDALVIYSASIAPTAREVIATEGYWPHIKDHFSLISQSDVRIEHTCEMLNDSGEA